MMNNVTMARNKPAVVVSLTVVGNADSYPDRSFVLRPPSFAMSIGRSSSTRDGKYLPNKDNGWFESRVVSRGHAVIKASPDMKAVFVEDIGSMHGTFVNERKVDAREKAMLVTGDILRFGTDVSRGPDTFPPLRATVDYKWINERAIDLPQEIQRAFDAYDDEGSDIEFLEESPYKKATNDTTRQSRTFSVPDSDVSVAGSISDGDDIQEISASEAMSSARIFAHSTDEAAEEESHTPSSSQKANEPISPQTPDAQIEPEVDVVPETIADNLASFLAPVIKSPSLKKIAHTDAPQTFINDDYQPLDDENMTESDYESHDSDEYSCEEEYSDSGDGELILESMKRAQHLQSANTAPIVEESIPTTCRNTANEPDNTLSDPQSLKSPRQTPSQVRAPSPSDAAMPKPVPSVSRPQSKPASEAPHSTTSFRSSLHHDMYPYGFTSYGGPELGVNPSHISYDTYRLPAPPEPYWLSNQVYRPSAFTGSVPTYPSDISPFPLSDTQLSGVLPENNADRQSFVHFLEQGPSNLAKTSDKAEGGKPEADKTCKKVSISEIIGEHKQPEATTSTPRQRGTKRKMDVVEREEDFSSPMLEEPPLGQHGSSAPVLAATSETTDETEILDAAESVLESPSIVITEAPAIDERPAKRVKTEKASKSARKVPSLVKYAAVATLSAFAGAAGLFSVLVAMPDDYFVGAK